MLFSSTKSSKILKKGKWLRGLWILSPPCVLLCILFSQTISVLILWSQPKRSFNLISMLFHCLHKKITNCLLVLINQLRKLDNSFSCELVSSLSAYESCLIYLEQSCHSILSSSMVYLDDYPQNTWNKFT